MAVADEIMRATDTTGWRSGLRTVTRVTRLALQTPWLVMIALVSTLIASVLQLLIPILLGRAIDQTQLLVNGTTGTEAASSALLTTALLVLAVSVLRGVVTTFQNYFSESVGHNIGYMLRVAYYEKIQNLSFGFHDRVHSGDLITLGMLDLEGVRMFFSTGLVRLALLSILIGIGGYMLLSTDLVLGLLALSFVPFVAWRSSVTQLMLFAPKPSLYAGPAFGRSSSGARPKEGAHGAEGRYPQPDQPAVRLCIPHPLSDGDRRMRQGGAGTAERRCRSRQRLHSRHVKFSPAACPHRRNPTRGKPMPTMTLDKRQGYCVLSTYVLSTTYKWNRWTPLRKEKQRNATFCIQSTHQPTVIVARCVSFPLMGKPALRTPSWW